MNDHCLISIGSLQKLSMLPIALLPGPVDLEEHASAMHLPRLPLTFVVIPVGEQKFAPSLLFAFGPVSNVG